MDKPLPEKQFKRKVRQDIIVGTIVIVLGVVGAYLKGCFSSSGGGQETKQTVTNKNSDSSSSATVNNKDVKVTCSCGNTFVTGSTLTLINTELCSNCHPFYTGEQKIVDTDNLVSKFQARQEKSSAMSFRSKKEKMEARKQKFEKIEKKAQSGLTLKDMLSQISK